jgi:hypothetical protein
MNPTNPTDPTQFSPEPKPQDPPTPPNVTPVSEPMQPPSPPQQEPFMASNLENTPQAQPAPETPFAPAKKSRKKWLVPAIIAGVLVVLGSGTALAYNFWYQNPEKVMTDALLNAVKAKDMTYKIAYNRDGKEPGAATIAGAFTGNSLSADLDMSFTTSGTKYAIKGSGIFGTDKALYVKISNVDELSKSLGADVPASAKPAFNDFVSKINNQWIKLTPDQSKDISGSVSAAQTCFQSAVNKIQTDKSYSDELVTLYKAHPLMKITKNLGSQNGSLGYQVADNPSELKAFNDGFKNTKLYKMIHDCDNSFALSDDTSSASNQTMDIWVSRWTHQLTKLSMSNKEDNGDNSTLSFEPLFNTHPTIDIPSKSMSVDELMKDFQDLQTAVIKASFDSSNLDMNQSPDLFSSQV